MCAHGHCGTLTGAGNTDGTNMLERELPEKINAGFQNT